MTSRMDVHVQCTWCTSKRNCEILSVWILCSSQDVLNIRFLFLKYLYELASQTKFIKLQILFVCVCVFELWWGGGGGWGHTSWSGKKLIKKYSSLWTRVKWGDFNPTLVQVSLRYLHIHVAFIGVMSWYGSTLCCYYHSHVYWIVLILLNSSCCGASCNWSSITGLPSQDGKSHTSQRSDRTVYQEARRPSGMYM